MVDFNMNFHPEKARDKILSGGYYLKFPSIISNKRDIYVLKCFLKIGYSAVEAPFYRR